MFSFILALDCSTSQGSMALGWRTAQYPPVNHWQTEFSAGRGCGGKLFTSLEEAMSVVRDLGDPLVEIVVGLGPGSYSGVRQAIAAATGLAAATGAALRGVPSVAALPVDGAPHHVVGDARRGTFYYTAVHAGTCLVGPELLASADALSARVAAHPDWPVYTVESALPDGLLPDAVVSHPLANRLLVVPTAARQLPPLEPIYLRPVSITLPKPRPTVVP